MCENETTNEFSLRGAGCVEKRWKLFKSSNVHSFLIPARRTFRSFEWQMTLRVDKIYKIINSIYSKLNYLFYFNKKTFFVRYDIHKIVLNIFILKICAYCKLISLFVYDWIIKKKLHFKIFHNRILTKIFLNVGGSIPTKDVTK